MNLAVYILRSVVHYRLAYVGVLAGAVLGATVLLGALFAGDSVAHSLRQIGRNRTGHATHVIAAGERFFREALAADLARSSNFRTAAILLTRGTAAHSDTQATANQVQLVGVTDTFWRLAPEPADVAPNAANATVAINTTLARHLQLAVGDTIIIRLQKPGILAGDAPIAGSQTATKGLRCTVGSVVTNGSFGRFSLEASQVPPSTVFLPIQLAQDLIAQPGGANLLLVDAASGNRLEPTVDLSLALRASMQLADYGLSLEWREQAGVFELTSRRIFIDSDVVSAVAAAIPSAEPVVSYLVNEFSHNGRTTPYSIATAVNRAAAPFLPPDLKADEVVLNEWLAEDLAARPGDRVSLKFYTAGSAGTLAEQSATFRVRSVVPLTGLAADRTWMPEFPGISDAKKQGDWDSGLPLDLNRIRDKDERYWDAHRGTPKAFLSLEAGRNLWGTRWGDTTALRIPSSREAEPELTRRLLDALRPEQNQIVVQDFAARAEESARSPVDFGGLMVGMSVFLIAAALGLVAMLFQFSLLQRNREDALLGAVGLPARKLLRWHLAEGFTILVIGTAVGLALATVYTRFILTFLESIWQAHGTGAAFTFDASPASIAIGSVVFLGASMLALWLGIRRLTRSALSIRLAASVQEIAPTARLRRSSMITLVACTAVAVLAIALSGRGLPVQAGFYMAGFALLAGGLALCRWWLARTDVTAGDLELTPRALAASNLKARRSRTLTVVGLIATAVFMVLSVASFRKNLGDEWLNRNSGTGGFTFWVETTAPINPVRQDGSGTFEIFEPHAAALGKIVPLRVGVGDNANCFNLNSVTQPRLLAVNAAELDARKAFRPKVPGVASEPGRWTVLQASSGKEAVPALVDETTLLWALKRKVGDLIAYRDENGRYFDVEIVGTLPDSIFQGYLILDETQFLNKYPSSPGFSVFLVDAQDPTADLNQLRRQIETSARDVGARVDLTRDVLGAFHQIENTYIAIFNVLGSLGVILGSLGLSLVIARNLQERRAEFAAMMAMGIPQQVLGRMVFAEYARLVAWGVSIGVVGAVVAVVPALGGLPRVATLTLVTGLLAGITLLNLASGWVVFRRTARDLRLGSAQVESG